MLNDFDWSLIWKHSLLYALFLKWLISCIYFQIDGQIARNWKSQASKMGSFLDPMADKLLVGSLVISLSYANLFPMWLCAMVLSRDVFLIGAGFVIRYISLPPPVNTLFFFLSIIKNDFFFSVQYHDISMLRMQLPNLNQHLLAKWIPSFNWPQ